MKTKPIAFLGASLAAVAGMGFYLAPSPDGDAEKQETDAPQEARPSNVPEFGQESEKRRYVEAVASGKARAISVLEAAIAKAEASQADENLIAQLKARLAERKRELAAISPE